MLRSRNPTSSRAFTTCRQEPTQFGSLSDATSGRGSRTDPNLTTNAARGNACCLPLRTEPLLTKDGLYAR